MSARKIAVLGVLALVLGAGLGVMGIELLRPPRQSTVDPIEVEAVENQSAEAITTSPGPVMDGAQPVSGAPPTRAGSDDDVTLDDDDLGDSDDDSEERESDDD